MLKKNEIEQGASKETNIPSGHADSTSLCLRMQPILALLLTEKITHQRPLQIARVFQFVFALGIATRRKRKPKKIINRKSETNLHGIESMSMSN